MKKLVFIAQAKGGAGKSVLEFLLCEKYPEARVVDMDDATSTTTNQLAYRQPVQVTFLDSKNNIDRGLFDDFVETIANSDNDFFICDLGASISEQLPFYLISDINGIAQMLKDYDIEIQICVPVGGSDIFKATLSYLEHLRSSINGVLPIKIYKNEYFQFSPSQLAALDDYATSNSLPMLSYSIVNDTSESVTARIKEVLSSGTGIESASPISKRYFKKAIEEISL